MPAPRVPATARKPAWNQVPAETKRRVVELHARRLVAADLDDPDVRGVVEVNEASNWMADVAGGDPVTARRQLDLEVSAPEGQVAVRAAGNRHPLAVGAEEPATRPFEYALAVEDRHRPPALERSAGVGDIAHPDIHRRESHLSSFRVLRSGERQRGETQGLAPR